MGMAKRAWMEAQERGWHAEAGRFVCSRCIYEDYLSRLVTQEAVSNSCDFCGDEDDEPLAAPFDMLVEVVATAVLKRYGDVDGAGTPYADGAYIDEPMGTDEVMSNVGFDATKKVWDAVRRAFTFTDWVEAPRGSWGELPLNRELHYAWQGFSHEVRYRTRFHFHRQRFDFKQDGISPADMMDAIGNLITRAGLVGVLDPATVLYRGRIRRPSDTWEPGPDSLGAPPADLARSGRMNPTGIPYLYLALGLDTMLAELGPLNQDEIVQAGVYSPTRAIRVVDFTALPEIPSLFDPERSFLFDEILFLRDFVREISTPVERPRLDDIHYVPTQVMCEYLAQALELADGDQVEGILYPSAASPGGRNLALFPSRSLTRPRFDAVTLTEVLGWAEMLARRAASDQPQAA